MWGNDLEYLPWWRSIPPARLKELNRGEKILSAALDDFHGAEPLYKSTQFADENFLNSHQFGGDTLHQLLSQGVKMPSDALLDRLLKKKNKSSGVEAPVNRADTGSGSERRELSYAVIEEKWREAPGANFCEPFLVGVPERRPIGRARSVSSKAVSASAGSSGSSRKRESDSLLVSGSVKKARIVEPRPVGEVEGDDLTIVIKDFERWHLRDKAHLHALEIFTLPRDKEGYAEASSEQKAFHLKKRVGMFMCNVMMMVEEHEELGKSHALLWDKKKQMDGRVKELKKRVEGAEKRQQQVETENEQWKKKAEMTENAHVVVSDLLRSAKEEVDRLKEALSLSEQAVEAANKAHIDLISEHSQEVLRLEDQIEKALDEAEYAWKEAYQACFDEFVTDGANPAGKSYEEYKLKLEAARAAGKSSAKADEVTPEAGLVAVEAEELVSFVSEIAQLEALKEKRILLRWRGRLKKNQLWMERWNQLLVVRTEL